MPPQVPKGRCPKAMVLPIASQRLQELPVEKRNAVASGVMFKICLPRSLKMKVFMELEGCEFCTSARKLNKENHWHDSQTINKISRS